MASPAVTYTFSNSTTADATQVNQNFTDIINGISDGTKDLSISALTAAGTATLNGHVNLGNSSADDLTITASLAAHLAIKTTATYDIGSSSIGLRAIYLGNSTFTTKIETAATATWTLGLPPTAPSAGKYLKATGSATTVWDEIVDTVVSKTNADSPYTALSTDDLILCDASSGAITVNLPTAVGISGRRYIIKKIDTSLANAVTIDGSGSETIDGSTTATLSTQFEALVIESDNSNWQIINRRIPSIWTAYTPTFTGFGTASAVSFLYRRNGGNLEIRGFWTSGVATATEARVSFPTDVPAALASLPTISWGGVYIAGDTATQVRTLLAEPSVAYVTFGISDGVSAQLTKQLGNGFSTNGRSFALKAEIPIIGWGG